jgi:hypothetical protein
LPRRVSVLLPLLLVCLALPAAYAAAKPGRRTIEHALLLQMNSAGYGRITRRVVCASERTPSRGFACRLESVRSTSLDVDVAVVDGGLRTTWYPLKG